MILVKLITLCVSQCVKHWQTEPHIFHNGHSVKIYLRCASVAINLGGRGAIPKSNHMQTFFKTKLLFPFHETFHALMRN